MFSIHEQSQPSPSTYPNSDSDGFKAFDKWQCAHARAVAREHAMTAGLIPYEDPLDALNDLDEDFDIVSSFDVLDELEAKLDQPLSSSLSAGESMVSTSDDADLELSMMNSTIDLVEVTARPCAYLVHTHKAAGKPRVAWKNTARPLAPMEILHRRADAEREVMEVMERPGKRRRTSL